MRDRPKLRVLGDPGSAVQDFVPHCARDASSMLPRAFAQADVDVLLTREAQQLLDAFLAAEDGLLVAADRRPEEMLRHVVDPDVAGLDCGSYAMRGDEIVGPDRAGEPVF